jgi:hypothetical protein
MDLTETIVALGVCAVLLAVAVLLDSSALPAVQAQLHPGDDHLPGGVSEPPSVDFNSTRVTLTDISEILNVPVVFLYESSAATANTLDQTGEGIWEYLGVSYHRSVSTRSR